jgi:hypothetical protein
MSVLDRMSRESHLVGPERQQGCSSAAGPVLSLESKVLAVAAWEILMVTLGGMERETWTPVLSELTTNWKPDAWRGPPDDRLLQLQLDGRMVTIWEGPPPPARRGQATLEARTFLHD